MPCSRSQLKSMADMMPSPNSSSINAFHAVQRAGEGSRCAAEHTVEPLLRRGQPSPYVPLHPRTRCCAFTLHTLAEPRPFLEIVLNCGGTAVTTNGEPARAFGTGVLRDRGIGRLFLGSFREHGWESCETQTMSIQTNYRSQAVRLAKLLFVHKFCRGSLDARSHRSRQCSIHELTDARGSAPSAEAVRTCLIGRNCR